MNHHHKDVPNHLGRIGLQFRFLLPILEINLILVSIFGLNFWGLTVSDSNNSDWSSDSNWSNTITKTDVSWSDGTANNTTWESWGNDLTSLSSTTSYTTIWTVGSTLSSWAGDDGTMGSWSYYYSTEVASWGYRKGKGEDYLQKKSTLVSDFTFCLLEFWISKILIHARKNDFENFSKKKREKLLYLPKCSWLSMSMLKSNLDRWTNVRYPFLYFPRMDSNNGVLQIVK